MPSASPRSGLEPAPDAPQELERPEGKGERAAAQPGVGVDVGALQPVRLALQLAHCGRAPVAELEELTFACRQRSSQLLELRAQLPCRAPAPLDLVEPAAHLEPMS